MPLEKSSREIVLTPKTPDLEMYSLSGRVAAALDRSVGLPQGDIITIDVCDAEVAAVKKRLVTLFGEKVQVLVKETPNDSARELRS